MAKKKENHTKILVNLPNELLEKVEDYKFENRCTDRNEAIEALLKKGLELQKDN